MKVNLHTHTTYCDGKNSPEEMILDAISAGFDVLGFSGHSYTSFDESYCMSREQTLQYTAEIRALSKKYKEKITVFCGIEQDFFADDSPESFDYAIGSVHAIFKPFDMKKLSEEELLPPPEGIIPAENGCYVYVDWTAEAMAWAIRWLYGCDALSLAEDYFDHVAHLADYNGIQIAGHLDLLTKFNEQRLQAGRPPIFDTEDPRYQNAARHAIEKLAAAGIIFEINTGAMSKGCRTSPYPSLSLLQEICRTGGRIMINSDCHASGKLDCGYELSLQLAQKAGFSSITVLSPDRQWTEISLTEVTL